MANYKSFCLKKGMDTSNLIFLKDSSSFLSYYSKKEEDLKYFNIGLPELYVFDSNSTFLKYKPDTACNAPGFAFTENVCDKITKLQRTDLKFQNFAKYFNFENGKEVKDLDIKGYDAVIVISWAKYMGKLNKDHVKVWEDNLKKQNPCKLLILKACLDPIKGMNLDLETEVKTK